MLRLLGHPRFLDAAERGDADRASLALIHIEHASPVGAPAGPATKNMTFRNLRLRRHDEGEACDDTKRGQRRCPASTHDGFSCNWDSVLLISMTSRTQPSHGSFCAAHAGFPPT